MPRIAGVDIPADKPIWISLRYIFGVGPTNSQADPQGSRHRRPAPRQGSDRRRTGQDHRHHRPGILVEGALRRQIQQNIARLRDIGSYRGNRHRRSLPVRGQRTRSNARTRKGPRKTVAGKKGVKELGK